MPLVSEALLNAVLRDCQLVLRGRGSGLPGGVLNILSAPPALVFTPNPTLQTLAAVGVVGIAVVILLAVLPGMRRVYT